MRKLTKFAQNLKKCRVDHEYTQNQLANKMKCSPSEISYLEGGLRNPSYETLLKASSALKVSTDYLLGIEWKNKTNLEKRVQHISVEDKKLVEGLVELLIDRQKKGNKND